MWYFALVQYAPGVISSSLVGEKLSLTIFDGESDLQILFQELYSTNTGHFKGWTFSTMKRYSLNGKGLYSSLELKS